MKTPVEIINAITPLRSPLSHSPWRRGFVLLTLGVCFAVLPTVRAVDPPPDGGYPTYNTAEGENALFSLTTGVGNTAIGFETLYSNTTGFYNTANGNNALHFNTTGNYNTANGVGALGFNTTGISNTADGFAALANNSRGVSNTAVGFAALVINETGKYNVAIGASALSNTMGSNNIALGFRAGSNLTRADNNIEIGNLGVPLDKNTIRIGTPAVHSDTFVAGISGVTVPEGVGVIVDTSGRLGTVVSSERFKDAIKPMDKVSEAILALKPVTFHYKKELDPKGIPQFGLVAEEVAKVDPDLVARDEQGKPYTVRYEAVNSMLLNEFLKEHRKVEEQSNQIARQDSKVQKLEAAVSQLQAALAAQAAEIQKVSDQIATQAPVAHLVANDRPSQGQ